MKKWILLGCFLSAISLVGCCEDEWDDWDDDGWDSRDDATGDDASDGYDECVAYCRALIDCDFIADASFNTCFDLCWEEYYEDEVAGIVGTHCVATASCDREEIAECGFSPVPLVGSSGDGDDDDPAGMGGGTSDVDPDPPEPDVKSCEVHHDCALNEDCVEGACLPRCAASCQCSEGMACDEGYCRLPEEPAVTCETDCDCTSGESCTDGTCS